VGVVSGSNGNNVIELASAASAGTIGGLGSSFTGFGTVTIDTSASWTLTGSNRVADLTDDGALALGANARLDVTAAVDQHSTGVFDMGVNSRLEFAADRGASDRIAFLRPSELLIDNASAFGTGLGTTGYQGPLLRDFGIGDSIDLKDVVLAGAGLRFTQASGLLQISASHGATVATLAFDTASLGSGTFHAANDGTGHVRLTHS
jgi:hypothetical protein